MGRKVPLYRDLYVKDPHNLIFGEGQSSTTDVVIDKSADGRIAVSGGMIMTPTRPASILASQQFGARFVSDSFFVGTASGAHGWLVGLTGDRAAANPTVGADLNDAYIRITGNNRADNQANYIYRGVNCSVVNRNIVGEIDGGTFTADTRSGSTSTTIIGLIGQADVGDCQSGSTVLAADFTLRRQAATTPSVEAGIRIRNRALGNQADAAIKVIGEDGTIVGFTRLITAHGNQKTLKVTSGKVTLASIDIAGTAYYVRASASAVTVETDET